MLYLAALLIVASVALFVAAPLGGGLLTSRRIRDAAEAERLEHELGLAMQGLRELDFDREMGKLSDDDCEALCERLMARALDARAARAPACEAYARKFGDRRCCDCAGCTTKAGQGSGHGGPQREYRGRTASP
jgi:hypothetical protein